MVGREHAPKVVVLGISLPEIGCNEIATRLREEACSNDAAIIAVSGYGEEQSRIRSREAGFDHHRVKPFDFEEVLSVTVQEELLRPALTNIGGEQSAAEERGAPHGTVIA